MRKFAVTALLIAAMSGNVQANQNVGENENALKKEPIFDVRFGFSPFLGIIAFEVQKGNYAFGVGMPGNIGVTYYSNPQVDSMFFSVGLGRVSFDEYDEKENGVLYEEKESKFVSVGGGYRWQWNSGWNITADIAVRFSEDEYTIVVPEIETVS